jgi:uncharacterized protein YdhG (YjbR/CyaY superfamily)
MAGRHATVDDYISSFPADVQVVLEKVRQTVLKVAPTAAETIKYDMPTMTLDGKSLVHFAAWKHHISIYPMAPGDAAFERDMEPYAGDKGTVKFPLREPIRYDLIERLVTFLVQARSSGADE